MSSHYQAAHPHGDLVNVDVHHEESDINLRALTWFVVVLTVIVLAVDVVCWGMFRLMNLLRGGERAVRHAAGGPAGPSSRPGRPLRTTPRTDLQAAARAGAEYLNSYGWVDERLGVVRVPIAKAKEMLLKKGIPVRPSSGTRPKARTSRQPASPTADVRCRPGSPIITALSGLPAPAPGPAAPKSPAATKAGVGKEQSPRAQSPTPEARLRVRARRRIARGGSASARDQVRGGSAADVAAVAAPAGHPEARRHRSADWAAAAEQARN